jgi:hypothetical protein
MIKVLALTCFAKPYWIDTMSLKIASQVRRKVLVMGASTLSLPLASWAATTRSSRALPPAWWSDGVSEAIEPKVSGEHVGEIAEVGFATAAGQRLVLSGRVTDIRGGARAGVDVMLKDFSAVAVSDADGRFLIITTVPEGDRLELLFRAESGQTLQKSVSLFGPLQHSAVSDSLSASTLYEGHRVWRSSFNLSMSAS